MYLTRRVLLLFLATCSWLLPAGRAYAQCPTPAGFMHQVISIEDSEVPDTVKQRQFQSLLVLQQRCVPRRDSITARILHRLGNLYRLEGDWEQALRYTKEAVNINRQGKGAQSAFLANSYYNLGLFYYLLHLYPESQQYYDSCIMTGMRYPEKEEIALMAFEEKAYAYFAGADFQKGVETADLGILFARSKQDTLREVALLIQKSQSQLSIRDTTQAGITIRQALRLLPVYALAETRTACNTVYAAVLGHERRYREAVALYQQAIRENERRQNWGQCALNLMDLGNLCAGDMKAARQAIRYYQAGVKYALQSKDAYTLAGVYNNIGYGYWQLGQYRKALTYYQQALNTLPIHFTDTGWQHNPTFALLKAGANDYYISTFLSNKGESLLALYKSTKERRWLVYALAAFRAADMSVDLMRWKQYGAPSRLFWRNKVRRLYQQAIETCYLLENPASAFRFFEKSRAVLLNDKLNELGARRYLSEQALSREQALHIQVVAREQELHHFAGAAAEREARYQRLLQARDTLDQFIRGLEKAYPAYYQYKYDTTVYTIAALRQHLQAGNKSYVTYFAADTTLFVLSVSAGTCKLQQAAVRPSQLQELLQLCTLPQMDTMQYRRYRTLAYGMYRQLVLPMQLSSRQVIVSPDEHLLPFEALLYDSAVAGSYLLKRHIFSYTYAASALLKPAGLQAPAADSRLFLGVAPVNYAASIRQVPLIGSDRSLQAIKGGYPSSLCLSGEAATRRRFLEELPRSRIVQLYSHASAGTGDQEPVLYLRDSALYLPEIQLVRNGVTALVILSACEAGTGRQAGGEGVLSLARGVALTGIPATVATLWQIDDQATYALTAHFHRFLSQGMQKDEALQQAKLLYLADNDLDRQLPYYWAAAVLLGDSSPVIVAQHRTFPYWLVAVLAGIVLILTLLLLRYRKRK